MTNDPVLQSDRMFQLWLYVVSFKQLLLRSNRGGPGHDVRHPTRIEVLFTGVAFVSIHPFLNKLSISESSTASLPNYLKKATESAANFYDQVTWYRLESEGGVGHIAAHTLTTREDHGEYDDVSSLLSGLPPGYPAVQGA